MSDPALGPVVIGVGNPHRRDDGLGPAVAALVAGRGLPGVRVETQVNETACLIDAWARVSLAVVVDAVLDVAASGGGAGRVRCHRLEEFTDAVALSSHDLSLRGAYELGRALGRAPEAVTVVTVEVSDTGYGEGLSPAVAAALPAAVRMVEAALAEHAEEVVHQSS